ncbi:3-hydroxyisobutyryl-CoA hydrolase 1 [Vitis vinifera]|uniref:3-hydroxyisobutyryl-CoA hydrolase n=1 Tax=Vitis vinifera TaxID=29760 RepID=A0A438HT91_VITVI|nr:3-hydroxyisobutyryl-CoA hydrolase 1 [Vitis vinifera]
MGSSSLSGICMFVSPICFSSPPLQFFGILPPSIICNSMGNGRAFCAGGDVAAVVRDINGGDWRLGAKFFWKEFILNYVMATYSKPQVSILNGIVMGGGAGASMHGRFRIATENSPHALKSLGWLVAHKKVNTNDLLQLKRPYKALSPDICKLCMKQRESTNHLFLHCSLSMGLWHRLFQLAKMDWVSPRSISDMMSINYKGFGTSKRGIVLWQNACIALIWVVWRERNARIFEDKARNSENLWIPFTS